MRAARTPPTGMHTDTQTRRYGSIKNGWGRSHPPTAGGGTCLVPMGGFEPLKSFSVGREGKGERGLSNSSRKFLFSQTMGKPSEHMTRTVDDDVVSFEYVRLLESGDSPAPPYTAREEAPVVYINSRRHTGGENIHPTKSHCSMCSPLWVSGERSWIGVRPALVSISSSGYCVRHDLYIIRVR